MYKYKTIIICALFLLLCIPAFGQEILSSVDSTISKHFPNTLKFSKQIALIDRNKDVDVLNKTAELWKGVIIEESKLLIDAGIDIKPHIDALVKIVTSTTKDNWPELYIIPTNTGYEFGVDYSKLDDGLFDETVNEKCKSITEYKTECVDVLEQLREAILIYKKGVVIEETANALEKLKLYTNDWEKYYTKARSQTFLELLVNSEIFRNEITSPTFVQPPGWQLILFHPNILMEHVSAAPQGDEFKEALALEWIGINWWKLKVPFGFSLFSTFSDRAEVSDAGHGVLFHFYNHYSIGATYHDGDMGVSVSIDLLKIFESKRSQIEQYEQFIDKKLTK